MRGSLAIHEGVVYVGAEERTAHVRAYDLDGAPLEAGFKFRGAKDGAAAVDGLAVDNDHRIWVADGVGGRVLGFSLVGTPLVVVPGGWRALCWICWVPASSVGRWWTVADRIDRGCPPPRTGRYSCTRSL